MQACEHPLPSPVVSRDVKLYAMPDFSYHAEIPSLGLDFRHCRTPFSTNAMHMETDECELTVYTEAGKSLIVEDTVYITPGIAVFTFRPGELHCGLHLPNNLHERYVVQIRPEKFRLLPGGDALLRCFFDREKGEHNMIVLPHEDERAMMKALDSVFLYADSTLLEREALMTAAFVRVLSLCCRYYMEGSPESHPTGMSGVLSGILRDMENTRSAPRTVPAYAAAAGISVSTMERLFRSVMQTTPIQYLRLRRLECAREYLHSGMSVTSACYAAGFSDYSHFIADFRRQYGITPAVYRRMCGGGGDKETYFRP